MKIYKYSDKSFANSAWIFFVFMFIGFTLFGLVDNDLTWGYIIIVGISTSLGAFLFHYIYVKRMIKSYGSIEIIFDENSITKKQNDSIPLTLDKSEIHNIQEVRKGLMLFSEDNNRYLLIPRGIGKEEYQEVKKVLSAWCTMENNFVKDVIRTQGAGLLRLIFLLVFYFSTSIYIYLPSILIVIGLYIWESTRKDFIYPKSKQGIYYGVIFLLVLVLMKVLILMI